MRHYLAPLIGLLGLLLATVLVVAVRGSHRGQEPVYSVATVQAGLAHYPGAWVGRTVVVRARAAPCPWWRATARLQHCAGQLLVLIGTATDAPTEPLPLLRPAPSPLWTRLRRLPWLGDLLPRPVPMPVAAFVPARYRVRLLALPACADIGCYGALLLAVAPPQIPRWTTVATYWVQVRSALPDRCGSAPCYEGGVAGFRAVS